MACDEMDAVTTDYTKVSGDRFLCTKIVDFLNNFNIFPSKLIFCIQNFDCFSGE